MLLQVIQIMSLQHVISEHACASCVIAGYRMPKPDQMPENVDLLMRRCWQHDPKSRPSFDEVRDELHRILGMLGR